jgi:hypothetical protein
VAHLLGVPSEVLVGSLATNHVTAESRPALRAARDTVLTGRATSLEADLGFIRVGDEPVQVTCTLSQADWNGEPCYRISMRRRSDVE